MTPLAHKILKSLLDKALPAHYREDALALHDVHCFDITEITEMAWRLAYEVVEGQTPFDCSETFLPAERTWIEFDAGEQRQAFLLVEQASGILATPYYSAVEVEIDERHLNEWQADLKRMMSPSQWRQHLDEYNVPWWCSDTFPLKRMQHGNPCLRLWPEGEPESDSAQISDYMQDAERAFLAVCLSLINTPKLVGRRQHMPHRGLQKRLLAQGLPLGRFPLRAYTEVYLPVGEPPKICDGHDHEAHLTGKRPMHFCRAHLRVRLGRLEIVKGHWRGDPSLGIKRSRYRVGLSQEADRPSGPMAGSPPLRLYPADTGGVSAGDKTGEAP